MDFSASKDWEKSRGKGGNVECSIKKFNAHTENEINSKHI
jgi:hypothetical protein